MQTESQTIAPNETWEQLAPLLEDAMGQLGDQDRAAVVLRFFGGKSFAEVAAAAGISENAAKKRVGHALEKLHRYFVRRGVSSIAYSCLDIGDTGRRSTTRKRSYLAGFRDGGQGRN